ncbi:hypothetical protein [Elizabethkingia anophelis]|uniref:hypothetical protein n=1 Tax=Elizabethkingia anophelis TaxID=1117645 RepID=UPI0038919E66
MKKKLLCIPLLGILAMSLSSCRSEDTIVQQTQNKEASKNFAVFTPKKAGETIDYAKGFAYLMKRYDKLQKTNLSGVNNKLAIESANASLKNNLFVSPNEDSYVEFNIRSQTIADINGDKLVVFPMVKKNKVIGLITATLTQNDTYVKYDTYWEEDEWYIKNVNAFEEALDRFHKKIRPLALNASIQPMAAGGAGCYWNGVEYVGCGIEGVTVNGRPKPKPGGGLPPGAGGENPEPGSGGGCGPHEDCGAPTDDGGGGPSPAPEAIASLPPKKPIKDMKKFLSCLDLTKPATLKIFAEKFWSDFPGHAFISITQGDNTMTYGFYPEFGQGKNAAGPGIMGDDSGSGYDIGRDFGSISPSVLKDIVDLSILYSKYFYSLWDYNCSDFALDVLRKAGYNADSSGGFTLPNKVFKFVDKFPTGNMPEGTGPNTKRTCD